MTGKNTQEETASKTSGDIPTDPGVSGDRSVNRLLPVLIVLRGNLGRNLFVLKARETMVGREGDNGIVARDPSVSRHHFSFVYENHDNPSKVPIVHVMDLGSRNGTMVNGSRVGQSTTLQFGDRVQAGNTIMCYVVRTPDEVRAEASRPAAPSSSEPVQTRVSVSGKASLVFSAPDETGRPQRLEGIVEDISMTGVRFRSACPPETHIGDSVRAMRQGRIIMQLADYPALQLEGFGRVAWVHRDHTRNLVVGIEVQEWMGDARDRVRDIIKARS